MALNLAAVLTADAAGFERGGGRAGEALDRLDAAQKRAATTAEQVNRIGLTRAGLEDLARATSAATTLSIREARALEAAYTLDDVDKWLLVVRRGADWYEIGRSFGADAAAARAFYGLGSAAELDAGTETDDVVQLEDVDGSPGLPAVDGSQLTGVSGMPRSYLAGLALSNNSTDTAHDIDIAAGACRDDGNTADMVLASALTKRLDASWAVGTDQGGLDGSESVDGTPDANTWYHVWLIKRSDTGVVDALFSESATAPTMPTDYDLKRRIGAVLTDGSANIIGFSQVGDEFLWKDPPLDLDATPAATSADLRPLSVPTGVKVYAKINVYFATTGTFSGSLSGVYVSSPDANDEAASVTAGPLGNVSGDEDVADQKAGFAELTIRTNTSAQIRTRIAQAASTTLRIATLGWVDSRGRND